ncbi:COX15/CtaA family protein [Candidatus Njordibacter sp. Uisw_002]|jgi:cytochrome c oxidase assembly protein subunit 15|uniref:COX15/CtaA family protein n=1 Tax=Candidatus Njordibacter sp. Uisw_002 TaxID=3230971 RepID=UPI003D463416
MNTPTIGAPKWSVFLTCIALAIVTCVIILGSWTRLADAGLGCPDWPGCYGNLLVPETVEAIAAAEALYPDAPVEVAKGWLEMIHRYFATLLGFIILVIAVSSWSQRKRLNYPFGLTQGLLAMVMLQGAFGAWTVTWKLWPQVVTAHLMGGFFIASLLTILLIKLRRVGRPLKGLSLSNITHGQLKIWTSLALLLVIAQIFLGGWMSSNYAALACSTLPDCNGTWWPKMNFSEGFDITQTLGPSYLGGLMHTEARTAIHVLHRYGAMILGVFLVLLSYRLMSQDDRRLRKFGLGFLVVFFVQFCLGLANIYYLLPLDVAVAHNFGGACLFVLTVSLNYVVFSSRGRLNEF